MMCCGSRNLFGLGLNGVNPVRSLNGIIGLFIDRSFAQSVSGARVSSLVFLIILEAFKTRLNKRES